MSDLVVIGFNDEFKAQEVRLTLLKLQKGDGSLGCESLWLRKTYLS